MRVLVLGGTGAMGSHLVNVLSSQGVSVTVTSRRIRTNKGSIKYVVGNAKNASFLNALLADRWDAIVDFMVYTTAEFRGRINNFLTATAHYLFLSSARVYAGQDRIITEESPRLLDCSKDIKYLRSDEYAITKAQQENLLLSSKCKNWTIIRPYITYSSSRLQLGVLEKEDWLYRVLKGRTLAVCGEIQQRATTVTHGRDVAIGIAALICKQGAYGEAFNLTMSKTVLWSHVLDVYMATLESYLEYRPKVIHQDLTEFCRWRRGYYQIVYDRLYDREFNNEKLQNFVDTSQFLDPALGLRSCLEHFLQARPLDNFQVINWREEALKDRALKEMTPLSEVPGEINKIKYLFYRNKGFGIHST